MINNFNIESKILLFFNRFEGRLPEIDIKNAVDLVSKREWGVGLENFCTQLSEYEIDLSSEEISELDDLVCFMGIKNPLG